jgi:hypothetical protein
LATRSATNPRYTARKIAAFPEIIGRFWRDFVVALVLP